MDVDKDDDEVDDFEEVELAVLLVDFDDAEELELEIELAEDALQLAEEAKDADNAVDAIKVLVVVVFVVVAILEANCLQLEAIAFSFPESGPGLLNTYP